MADKETNRNDGVPDESFSRISSAINELSESFGRNYERLNYPGFVSVLGAILVFTPLILRSIPFVNVTMEEQRLYVVSGVAFVILAAIWISVQNLLAYKLQRAKQEIACKMLEIKVSAMGKAQQTTIEAMRDTKETETTDHQFIIK